MQTATPNRFYPTVGQSIKLVVVLTLVTIASAIPFSLVGYGLKAAFHWEESLMAQITFLPTYVVSSLIIIRLGLKRFRLASGSDYKLKFAKVPARILVLAGMVLIAFMFITDSLTELMPVPRFFKDELTALIQPNVLSFLLIVIAPAVLEEILFRGIILEGLLKNYSPQKAIIWSALIFGMAHLNPWQAVGAVFIGLLIGWLYWKSNSLIPGMLLHALNNCIAYSLTLATKYEADSFLDMFSSRTVYVVLFSAALVIVVMGCKVLNRQLKRLPASYDATIPKRFEVKTS